MASFIDWILPWNILSTISNKLRRLPPLFNFKSYKENIRSILTFWMLLSINLIFREFIKSMNWPLESQKPARSKYPMPVVKHLLKNDKKVLEWTFEWPISNPLFWLANSSFKSMTVLVLFGNLSTGIFLSSSALGVKVIACSIVDLPTPVLPRIITISLRSFPANYEIAASST